MDHISHILAHSITPELTSKRERIALARKSPLEFEWDKKAQRYRITKGTGKGQFVSPDAVRSLTEKAITQQRQLASQLTEKLLNNEIDVADWERGIADALRNISIWQYSLGVGGTKQLQSRDYGLIGAEMRFQMGRLRMFSEQILAGQLTPAQIQSRTALYFEKTYGLYETGRFEAHYRASYRWMRRITVGDANTCQDCLDYALMDWRPMFSLPMPTQQCQCRANCRCQVEYSENNPDNQSRGAAKTGWIGNGGLTFVLEHLTSNANYETRL